MRQSMYSHSPISDLPSVETREVLMLPSMAEKLELGS
jgi:hypothetical protein